MCIPFYQLVWGCVVGPPPKKVQLPAHKVDSFWRSRPLDVFLTLEIPSSAPDSVILLTGRNRETDIFDRTKSLLELTELIYGNNI